MKCSGRGSGGGGAANARRNDAKLREDESLREKPNGLVTTASVTFSSARGEGASVATMGSTTAKSKRKGSNNSNGGVQRPQQIQTQNLRGSGATPLSPKSPSGGERQRAINNIGAGNGVSGGGGGRNKPVVGSGSQNGSNGRETLTTPRSSRPTSPTALTSRGSGSTSSANNTNNHNNGAGVNGATTAAINERDKLQLEWLAKVQRVPAMDSSSLRSELTEAKLNALGSKPVLRKRLKHYYETHLKQSPTAIKEEEFVFLLLVDIAPIAVAGGESPSTYATNGAGSLPTTVSLVQSLAAPSQTQQVSALALGNSNTAFIPAGTSTVSSSGLSVGATGGSGEEANENNSTSNLSVLAADAERGGSAAYALTVMLFSVESLQVEEEFCANFAVGENVNSATPLRDEDGNVIPDWRDTMADLETWLDQQCLSPRPDVQGDSFARWAIAVDNAQHVANVLRRVKQYDPLEQDIGFARLIDISDQFARFYKSPHSSIPHMIGSLGRQRENVSATPKTGAERARSLAIILEDLVKDGWLPTASRIEIL